MATDARVLILDVENSPNIAYTWGKYDQTVQVFKRESHLMSVAWKWLGEKTIHCKALPDFPTTYKRDKFDDTALIKDLWPVLNEADVMIGHNVDRFDIRKINRAYLKQHIRPYSPFTTIDTLKEIKKIGLFNSNKLGDICEYLFGVKKIKVDFKLWLDCLEGEPRAWAKMKKYNKNDITLTEMLYLHLRPWIKRHPNVSETGMSCPNCGGTSVIRRGWARQIAFKRRKYQCMSCGHWPKGERQKLEGVQLS